MGSSSSFGLKAVFEADVDDLKAGSKEASDSIEKVGETAKKTGLNAEQAGGKIKKGLEAIAKSAIYTSAIFGGELGQMLSRISAVSLAVGELSAVMGALATSKIALVSAGVAALVVAVYALTTSWEKFKETAVTAIGYVFEKVSGLFATVASYLSKLPFLGESVSKSLEDAARSFGLVNTAAAQANANMRQELAIREARAKIEKDRTDAFTKANQDYLSAIRRVDAQEQLFGKTKETLNARIAATKKALEDLVVSGFDTTSTAVQDLTKDYQYLVGVSETADLIGQLTQPEQKKPGEQDTTALTFTQELKSAFEDLHTTSAELAQGIVGIFQSVAQGIGDVVARAIIYGENLSDIVGGLLKSVGAQVISFFIQLAVQEVIYLIAQKIFSSTLGASKVGTYAGIASAAAAAASVEELGLVGIALAPAFGAAAALAVSGAASSGAATGAATGGAFSFAEHGALVTGPAAVIAGESRTRNPKEVIAPYSQFQEALRGEARTQTIIWEVDGRQLSRVVVKGAPREIRIGGAKTA